MFDRKNGAYAKMEIKAEQIVNKLRTGFQAIMERFENQILDFSGELVEDTELIMGLQLEVEKMKGKLLPKMCNTSFTSLDELANYHAMVVGQDERVVMFEHYNRNIDVNISELLDHLEDKLLNIKFFKRNYEKDERYIPSFLRKLFKATLEDDVGKFKKIVLAMEYLPASVSRMVLYFKFPKGFSDSFDTLPLLATSKASARVLNFLINDFADSNYIDNWGFHLAYRMAISRNKPKNLKGMEQAFIKLYSNPNVRKLYPGFNALLLAISWESKAILDFLIENGFASVNAVGGKSNSSILQGIIKFHVHVMFDELMKYGPDLSHVDWKGRNCLHSACNAGFHEIIPTLLNRCPELLEAEDVYHETPLETAKKGNNIECIETIEEWMKNEAKLYQVDVLITVKRFFNRVINFLAKNQDMQIVRIAKVFLKGLQKD